MNAASTPDTVADGLRTSVGVIVSGGNLDSDRLPWRCMREGCTGASSP